MREKTTTIILLLMTGCTVALGHVRAYAVDPVKAQWSDWTRTVEPYDRISQIITCNWDHLDSAAGAYVEFFVGSRGASPANAYKVNVYEIGGGSEPVAWHEGREAPQDHAWLKLPLTVEPGYEFTKGRQYEFRFTRSGADSIQYYYDSTDAYQWGSIVLPGQSAPVNDPRDLAMRVYGKMDTIGANWFGVNPSFLLLSFV